MKSSQRSSLVPGVFLATTLVFGGGAAFALPQVGPISDHAKAGAKPSAKAEADMKAECQAVMTQQKDAQTKFKAMEVTLDKLVAEMNTAKTSKETGAMDKAMAAVITELVAQRKATRAMEAEMQPALMAHQMHHVAAGGTMDPMGCPMMKAEMTVATKPVAAKP